MKFTYEFSVPIDATDVKVTVECEADLLGIEFYDKFGVKID